jgi:hypothetical protein
MPEDGGGPKHVACSVEINKFVVFDGNKHMTANLDFRLLP